MKSMSNFRWTVVALLFVVTIINYVDRSSIAYAIDGIAQEFHFSENQIGFILGAFGIGYTLTTIISGVAVDHYGARQTLAYSMLFWAAATALIGVSNGFLMVFLARLALGATEGPNFPGLGRAVHDWLPERERTRALSFALIAVPLSLAIGGPISTLLISIFTWRGAYFVLTGVTLLWIPFWWFLFRDKPSDSVHINKQELLYIQYKRTELKQLEGKHPWRTLLFNKTLLANNWAFFVFGFYLFFFMTWLPNYLNVTYHFNLLKIGVYTMFPWLLAAIMMLAVATLSDFIYKRTKSLRLSQSYPILLSQLLSALCIIPIIFVTSIHYAMVFISLAVGFAMSANASFYAANVAIAKDRSGTSLGIMDTVFAISGFLSPTLTGLVVSWSGNFEAIFWLMAGLGFSSVLLVLIVHNRE